MRYDIDTDRLELVLRSSEQEIGQFLSMNLKNDYQ